MHRQHQQHRHSNNKHDKRPALIAREGDAWQSHPRPGVLATRLALLAMMTVSGISATLPAHAQTSSGDQAGQVAVRSFDVPAGPLASTLNRLADQANLLLSVPTSVTAGKNSPGVRGKYSVDGAFQAALEGTGLQAARQADGTFAVIPVSTALPAGATLPTVQVNASAEVSGLPAPYAGSQVARGSRAGLLGNKDVLDTPFSTISYTAELMENQQAITLADVLANDPAVRSVSYGLTNAAGAGDSFLIRGFSIQNSVLFDGIPGIAPSRTLPVETAERIEVLKGPNALLNGMAPGAGGSVGGAINMVPKRADDQPLTRVTASYMSDGIVGGHLDLGRRFGEENQWGVRFNGSYRNGNTPTEGQSVELSVATIGIDYRGRELRVSLDAGHQTLNNKAPQGSGGFGIDDAIAVVSAPAGSTRVAQDWEFSRTRSSYLLLKGEYDINPDWSIYGAAGGSNNTFSYLSTDTYVSDAQGNAQATVYYWPDWYNYRVVQGGIKGKFNTGGIRHQINLGATYLKKDHGYTTDYYGFTSFATNIYNPPSVAAPSLAGFSSDPAKTDTLELPSVALSDTLSFLDDRIALTVGARHQRVKFIAYDTATGAGTTTYDQSALTPVLAAVFKLQPNWSVYGNYIEGLGQGDTAPVGTTNAGQVFPPIKTKQREIGTKYDLGRFMATASLFQVQKPSGLSVANGDGTYTYRVSGEQRNRGLELSFYGEVARGVRLLGGATYTDPRLTGTDGGANDGKMAANVSRWQLNLGGEYDPASLPGITLSARAISSSSQYLDEANTRSIAGWTRWDIGARYKTIIAGKSTVFKAGIQNLFNRSYWASGSGSWLYVGQPRVVSLSASVDF
ncbi:TonB-dependent receptor [Herbaspirillum lusitanum]|uniref:TonB-dependent receptor n=1 Tax=Herbaspirillum lusitanum TaxID=213312 RepID=A0ABW9A817_9BURK